MEYTIEKPCTESLEKMTPTEKGKFCLSCQKEVIDFRKKSRSEIKNYYLTHENVCGIFNNSQLKDNKNNHKPTFLTIKNVLMTGLLLTGVSTYEMNAQTKPTKIQHQNIRPITPAISKKVQQKDREKDEKVSIFGQVTDQNGDPVIFANIYNKEEKTGTVTDINGAFELAVKVPSHSSKDVKLIISCIGYEKDTVTIPKDNNHVEIQLKMQEELFIVGYMAATEYGFFRRAWYKTRHFFRRIFKLNK